MNQFNQDQIQHHYAVEKALATRLMNATKEERRTLYSELYNELYREVPFHPQLVRKASAEETKRAIDVQMELLKRIVTPQCTFIEIGPGDCALSFEAAMFVKQVYAIDVSDEITHHKDTPSNFELILSDGTSIPLEPGSIDVAYSNQLMEHLHPDDAFQQLNNIYTALKPGGTYICITPNRLTGPHDISKHFDDIATGFHLKEYTVHELIDLFRSVGFKKFQTYSCIKGKHYRVPAAALTLIENLLNKLPRSRRLAICNTFRLDLLLESRVVAIKD